jgi:hypothetical protein
MNSAACRAIAASASPARPGGGQAGSREDSSTRVKSSLRKIFSVCVQGTRSFTSAITARAVAIAGGR